MRVLPLFLITLLLAAPGFAQQAPSKSSANHQPTVHVYKVQQYPPLSAHPITAEQIHEIMRLTHANDLARQNLLNRFSVLRLSMPPYFPQDIFVEILEQSEKIDFEPIEKPIYQNYISAEDAAKVIAFYKTPAGQHLIAAMPGIARVMDSEGAREGTKIAQQVINEHADEMKAAAAKYQAEHPDSRTTAKPN